MHKIGKNKIGLAVDGIEELMERLEQAGGKAEQAAEKCLKESAKIIAPKLHQDMKKHHRSGKTEAAIIDNPDVEWEGTTASIKIGFDIDNGGLASVFLMYGTPRMPKDPKLYRDIYGSAVKKEIKKKQEEIMQQEIAEAMRG